MVRTIFGTEQNSTTLNKGDKFKLLTNKYLFGQVLHFEDSNLPQLVYQELPTELHPRPSKIAMARLLKDGGKFWALTGAEWNVENEKLLKKLPYNVQVEPRITQYVAGSVIPTLTVQVLDGNNDYMQLKQHKLNMCVFKKYNDNWESANNAIELEWVDASGGFVAQRVKLEEAVEHRYEFTLEDSWLQFQAGPQSHNLYVTASEVSECILRADSDLSSWTSGIRFGDCLPTVEMLLFDAFGNNRDAEGWISVIAETDHAHVHVRLPSDRYSTHRGDVSVLIEGIQLEYSGPAGVVAPTSVQIKFTVSSGTKAVKVNCCVSDDKDQIFDLDSAMPTTFALDVLPGIPCEVGLESGPVGTVIASQELPEITIGLRDSNGLQTYARVTEKWCVELTSPHITRSRKMAMPAETRSLTVDKLKLIGKDVDVLTDAAVFFKVGLGTVAGGVPTLQVPFKIRPTGHPNVLRLFGANCTIHQQLEFEAGSTIDDLQFTLHRVTETQDQQLNLSDFMLIDIAITGKCWAGVV